MYRQHLKMILAQDEESNKSKSEFINRMSNIPVVYLAWNIAAEAYSNIKTSNRFLNISLNSSEKIVYFISNPVIKTFEKPLKSVDVLACKGLNTLQGIVPAIRNQRQRFYRQTRNAYDETIESGLRKYEDVKVFGTSKLVQWVNDGTDKLTDFLASPYGEVCEIIFDFVLDAGDVYVDVYLPPLGDERPEKLFGDRGKEPVPKRVQLLKDRLKERLYKHTLLKIQMVKLKLRRFIVNFYQTDPHEYLVQVSSSLPEMLLSTVIQIFSNIQDMISYISVFLSHQQQCEDQKNGDNELCKK